jgi:hypothetical protein
VTRKDEKAGHSAARASQALRADIISKVVSYLLGRATVSITLDTYSHAIPVAMQEEEALIAGLVFAGK